jgi:co-chaperonin GroES (HSP10)
VDADANKTMNIVGLDGKRLYIDTDFNPHLYSARIGTVVTCPKVIRDEFKYDNPLEVGDIVVIHHFVGQKDNEVLYDGKVYYKADYGQIYAKVVNGVIVPLEDVIFTEYVKKKEEDKFVGSFQVDFSDGDIKQFGRIVTLSEAAKWEGLKVGDEVYLTKNANYRMNIFGVDVNRVRVRNITGVLRNGKMIVFGDRLLLKPIDSGRRFESLKDKGFYGEVVQGNEFVPTGSKVNFNRGITEPIEVNGSEMLLIKEKMINYIL